MENRVQIRRGNGVPGFGDLYEYELGYDRISKALYIRNEDGIEIVNSNVIQQIIADSHENGKNYVRAFIGDNWTINENATIEDYNTLVHRGETGVTLDDKSYLTIRFDIGDTYVLSGYVKGTPNLVIELRSLGGSESRIWTYNVVGDNYEYITEIFEIPAPGDYQLTLGGDGTETEGLYFKKLQIERGEIPSSWRPAPEDAAELAIDALIRLSTVETKITPEAITTTVRSSPLYTSDLDRKANSDEIISIINQTAEAIKIQASKIKFEGLVTANNNFRILTDGSIEANNAEISGRVTANSGTIGGWQLTSSLIQYRPDSSNNNSRFYFDSGPTGTYRIASYNSSGTRQFSVTRDGVLYARNVDIAGTITATSGTIGGWNIAGSYIDTKDGNARMYLASHADSASYYIHASNSSGSRMFSVSKTGVLYARGADISGKITADSGVIGGWEIQPTRLRSRVDSNNYFYIAPHGAYNYLISALSGGTRMFSIDQGGKLYARGADIAGTLTSSNVTVTGGTITGTTIRTGSGSNRIELSSNLLRSYSGGIRRVQLDYDSLDFYTPDNKKAGEIVAVPAEDADDDPMLQMRADSGIVYLGSRNPWATAKCGIRIAGVGLPSAEVPNIALQVRDSSYKDSYISLSSTYMLIRSSGDIAVVDSAGPAYGGNIMHRGRIQCGSVTLNSSTEVSVTFPQKFQGTPKIVLTPRTTTSGVIAPKVRSKSASGFAAIIGGSGFSGIVCDWIAMY